MIEYYVESFLDSASDIKLTLHIENVTFNYADHYNSVIVRYQALTEMVPYEEAVYKKVEAIRINDEDVKKFI